MFIKLELRIGNKEGNMENYSPYSITDKMLNYVSNIMEKIGEARKKKLL